MEDFIKRLTVFQIRYGDPYELRDVYDDIPTELERDIREYLKQRKYADLLEDLTQRMESEDYEEANEAMELWNDLRAFIAKGE